MSTPAPLASVVARLRSAGCVFAEAEAALLLEKASASEEARVAADLEVMIIRRIAGVPLEHILGWAEFRGMRVAVDPGVFVPRRRTEFLVEQALSFGGRADDAAVAARPPLIVVDLCCGSGAVGAALGGALGGIDLYAVDIDPAAVRCAEANVAAVGGRVFEGDLYEPLPLWLRGRVDLLVANAPYVPTGAIGLMPPEARLHEPRVALDGGKDGLEVQRRMISVAPDWLAPGGYLLVETSSGQGPMSLDIVAGSGLIPSLAECDDLDATVVIGRKPLHP